MAKKIGRNNECPCGSGLKYKKCCLEKKTTSTEAVKSENNVVEKTISILKSISNSQKVADEDGGGFYQIFGVENVEKVNPVEYYKNYEIVKRAINFRDLIEIKAPLLLQNLSDDFFIGQAKEQIESEKFWEIGEVDIPENFLKLLTTSRKKDQESLLKGLSINPKQLLALIFKSYEDYDYLYSKYLFQNLPKGLENRKIPKIADISEVGKVKTIGETDLTDGQVKNMIEQRKVIVAHFFDKGDDWHCLFTTYNSIDGKESWKGGQAHFHYISSAFGITRNDFLESMKSGKYKSTPIHIDLLDYGNQTIKNENTSS